MLRMSLPITILGLVAGVATQTIFGFGGSAAIDSGAGISASKNGPGSVAAVGATGELGADISADLQTTAFNRLVADLASEASIDASVSAGTGPVFPDLVAIEVEADHESAVTLDIAAEHLALPAVAIVTGPAQADSQAVISAEVAVEHSAALVADATVFAEASQAVVAEIASQIEALRPAYSQINVNPQGQTPVEASASAQASIESAPTTSIDASAELQGDACASLYLPAGRADSCGMIGANAISSVQGKIE